MNHRYLQGLTAEGIERKIKRSVSVVQSASSHRKATSTRMEKFFEIFNGEDYKIDKFESKGGFHNAG